MEIKALPVTLTHPLSLFQIELERVHRTGTSDIGDVFTLNIPFDFPREKTYEIIPTFWFQSGFKLYGVERSCIVFADLGGYHLSHTIDTQHIPNNYIPILIHSGNYFSPDGDNNEIPRTMKTNQTTFFPIPLRTLPSTISIYILFLSYATYDNIIIPVEDTNEMRYSVVLEIRALDYPLSRFDLLPQYVFLDSSYNLTELQQFTFNDSFEFGQKFVKIWKGRWAIRPLFSVGLHAIETFTVYSNFFRSALFIAHQGGWSDYGETAVPNANPLQRQPGERFYLSMGASVPDYSSDESLSTFQLMSGRDQVDSFVGIFPSAPQHLRFKLLNLKGRAETDFTINDDGSTYQPDKILLLHYFILWPICTEDYNRDVK